MARKKQLEAANDGGHHARVKPVHGKRFEDDEGVARVVKRPFPRQWMPTRQWWVAALAVGMVAAVFTVYGCGMQTSRTWIPASGAIDRQENVSVDGEAAAFIGWFQANGGTVSNKISIAGFDGMGRGIVARDRIQEHDALLFVPLDVMICRDTIWKHASKKLLAKFKKLQDSPAELLTAFLLLEQFKDASSFWFPYLRILPPYPRTFKGTASPLFFSSTAEVDELQDERMVEATKVERQHAKTAFLRFRRLFKNVLPADSAVAPLLEKRYLWARFLINSRAFTIRGDRYLVPFGDVFNGHPQPKQRVTMGSHGAHFLDYHRLQAGVGMEIRSDRDVLTAGEHVFEDYGDNDNYIYFLYHGFLMDKNPFDCAAARLPIQLLDPLTLRVLKDLARGQDPSPVVCVSPDGDLRSVQDTQAVQLLSSVVAMDNELLDALCSKRENYPTCIAFSTAKQQKQLLAKAIQQQLDSFATTVDADSALLENAGLSPSMHHAVRFRISRKRILETALSKLQESVHLADLREKEREAEAAFASAEDTSTPQSLAAKMDRFTRWISAQDLAVNHIALKYVSPTMGYGAFATKPLDIGETYLSVPTDLVMDIHSALTSPFIRDIFIKTRHLDAGWTELQLLLLHLLHECFAPARVSAWQPYLDVLPDRERLSSPLFYADDSLELQLLREAVPLDLLKLVDEYRRRVDGEYDLFLRGDALIPDWITRERFRWANAILDSRSIWWSGTRHLVPLLDMVNCVEIARAHAPHATRLSKNRDAAVTQASWAFAEGDQVVENYAQANYIFLLYHGFVLPENSYDCAHFHLELDAARLLPPHDNDRKVVIATMERMQLFSWSQDVCVGGQKGVDIEVLMRVALVAESPQRAAEAGRRSTTEISTDHVNAAKRATEDRLARLQHAIDAHHDHADRLGAVYTYVKQQHTQMEHVLARISAYAATQPQY